MSRTRARIFHFLAAVFVGAAVTAVPANPAMADTREIAGCADLVALGGTYDAGAYEPTLALRESSCPDVTYTVYVFDSDKRDADLLATQSVQGDDRRIQVAFARMDVRDRQDGDSAICVRATASIGGSVLDTIPPDGCVMSNAKTRVDYYWFP